MSKILSVVIPTYNMEKYLEKCLNSFIYNEGADELEVLIVNDGSKDNSVNIAKEFEKKYPNIFKVIDKENGGHGSTINAGLKVASGKYFKVVDADDWVETDELKKLIREKPFTKIAEEYEVTDNAIRKWCKSFSLPSKKSDIILYTDDEWNEL